MHEYPLTLQIIATAERYARENGASQVTAISLVIGGDSGCSADSIELYFDTIAADSICGGAELIIERVKPMLRCKKCGALFERAPFSFQCSKVECGGDGKPTEIGREFYIRSVTVKKE